MTQKIAISKPAINVLTATEADDFQINSAYGSLKYATKSTGSVTIDGDLVGNLDTVGTVTITHSLGYYPYIEVYVLNPLGEYEYCPTNGGGASTTWQIDVVITTTQIKIYTNISGFSSQPTFEFIVFIHKNDLNL